MRAHVEEVDPGHIEEVAIENVPDGTVYIVYDEEDRPWIETDLDPGGPEHRRTSARIDLPFGPDYTAEDDDA